MNKSVKCCVSWHTDRNQKPAQSAELERGGAKRWQAHSPIFHPVITAIGQDCGSDLDSVFSAHRLPLVQRPCGEEDSEGASHLMNQQTSTSTSWIPSWPETPTFAPAQNTLSEKQTFLFKRDKHWVYMTDAMKYNWQQDFISDSYTNLHPVLWETVTVLYKHINHTEEEVW